jgi:hypothetical protein
VRADQRRPPVDPEAIRAVLPDPKPPRAEGSAGRQRNGTARPDDELALIAPPACFLALCGVRVPDEGGMVRCPLPDHDDASASCQVYAEAELGLVVLPLRTRWGIHDLASLMSGGAWGRGLRGDAFRAARELVAAALG